MPDGQTRYAVLGTGALGGLYGALLAKTGQDVHFLARSDYHHVRSHGLRVDTPLGDFQLENVSVYQRADDMPKADVAIVAWKATANKVLPEVLPAVCDRETTVLVLQNGWDVERDSANVVGPAAVLGGCCFLCSNKIGPGHIRHLDYGRIAIGEYGESKRGEVTKRMQQIATDFEAAGIDMTLAEDLRKVRWKKLTWNIPFNGLSVALGADTRQIMTDEHTAQLAKDLMLEVQAAARHCGVEFSETHIQKMLDDTRKMVPYASSMLLDYQNKREMEVEAIVGNPLRAAQKAGYSPPKMEMLYQQLCYINRINQEETSGT